MVDWEDYQFNKELNISIILDNVKYDLIVKLIEYEYNLHREPQLAHLEIISSSDEESYPLKSIMRLPMKTEEDVNFLLFAPCDKNPNRELNKKGKFYIKNL